MAHNASLNRLMDQPLPLLKDLSSEDLKTYTTLLMVFTAGQAMSKAGLPEEAQGDHFNRLLLIQDVLKRAKGWEFQHLSLKKAWPKTPASLNNLSIKPTDPESTSS